MKFLNPNSNSFLLIQNVTFIEAEQDFRGHDFNLHLRSFRLLRRKAAFSVGLPISRNKLPMEVVNALRLILSSGCWT